MGRFRMSQLLLAVALVPLLTAGGLRGQTKPPPPPEPPPAQEPPKRKPLAFESYKTLKADAKDELRKLQIARYNEAVEEFQALLEPVTMGIRTQEILSGPGKRICEAGLELYDDPKDRIRLLTDYVELTKSVEQLCVAYHEQGRLGADGLHNARYARIDAEIQLLKAKRAAEKPMEK